MGASPLRNSRSIIVLLTALALLVSAMPASTLAAKGAAAAARFTSDGVYIVRMDALPAVVYDGSIKGLKATAPNAGAKINPFAAAVVRYTDYLTSRHDAALGAVGAATSKKLYSYVFTNDAFAARLTADQANRLAARKDVMSVAKDTMYSVDTSSTPTFLGLDARGGLWDQLGGIGHGGEDVIIGIVDSGIWPESLSFADRVDASGAPSNAPGAKRAYQQIPGWHGKCVPGEQFTATLCNQKLIGARYYNSGQGGNAGVDAQRPWEFNSVRDYNGHGTHTASTAGGNFGVAATGEAAVFGEVSGMAPRARIAAYKALWSTQSGDTASGSGADLAAAIDQAVADGVDVINYSVSGTATNFADGVEISFLFAAAAGVFVATSAGNSGPGSGTVAHPSPWLTTVAAGTHNRNGLGSLTLGDGTVIEGASVATAVGPAPFIDSETALNPAYTHTPVSGIPTAAVAVQLCVPGSLDPAVVAGAIVLCERGVIARVDKSKAVLQAGGAGMVMVNQSLSSTNADFHFVPSIHVSHTFKATLEAYAATTGATATINEATVIFTEPAPFTASFSSRGPLAGAGGDLLKPDVIAPGQDILAAVSPSINGRDFDLFSGTSMSSPHVAGLAALLMDLHPTWSPMAVKSALMTSGTDVLDGGTPAPETNPILIFRQGAGHVAPNSAADPGLVYNNGFNDWLAFLCGQAPQLFANPAATCGALMGAGFSIDASDMNVASIAIGDLAGIQTVKRRVTNVGSAAATYTSSINGLVGVTAVVEPASLTLNPGQTGTFTVTFTRTTATLSSYVGGQLRWNDGAGHVVRSPIVIRPVPLAAPAEVASMQSGVTYDVRTGYDGSLTFAANGLVAATERAGTVPQDPDQNFDPANPEGTSFEVVVPAGTAVFRAGVDESTISPAGTDLDVFVLNASGTLVALAADGDSNELATIRNPAAGTYTVWVHGFATVDPSASFTFYDWVVPNADAGNVNLPPTAVATTGGILSVPLTYTGLDATMWYLGQIVYGDGTVELGRTILSVR